jgi:hypothetical protein
MLSIRLFHSNSLRGKEVIFLVEKIKFKWFDIIWVSLFLLAAVALGAGLASFSDAPHLFRN